MARKKQYLCSFCGKNHSEVRQLITGSSANICDSCLIICNQAADRELRVNLRHLRADLPNLLFVENAAGVPDSLAQPVEMWINVQDISRIEIPTTTSGLRIYLRSAPDADILIHGPAASRLLARLSAPGGKLTMQ